MSLTYNITIPIENILEQSTLDKIKSFSLGFTILDILPRDEMIEILKANLLEKGFIQSEKNEIKLTLKEDITASLNLDNLQAEVDYNHPDHAVFSTNDDLASNMATFDEISKAVANNMPLPSTLISNVANKHAGILTDAVIDLKKIVNAAIKDTYKEAVVIKAKQLGNLEKISEETRDGIYKVRIEIES